MKSFRIQGDFCLSILPFIPPGPLRPEIYPLRHDIYPLRPEICSQTLNLGELISGLESGRAEGDEVLKNTGGLLFVYPSVYSPRPSQA